jgi:hypothetical protein
MYSLGATIYHALVGAAPFEGTDPNEVVKARFLSDAKRPSELRPGLPPAIDEVILKMMAREVIDRYPTWEACIGDINKLLAAGIVIDDSAAAKAELSKPDAGEDGESGGEEASSSESSPTSAKKGGRRLVLKGRRKMVMKKRSSASDAAEETSDAENGSEAADVDGVEPMEDGEDSAEIAEVDGEASNGKKQMTIGKMIMLGVVGIVVILVLAAGGIVWYVQSSRAAEAQKRMELLNAKAVEARDAIQTTLKAHTPISETTIGTKEYPIPLREPLVTSIIPQSI